MDPRQSSDGASSGSQMQARAVGPSERTKKDFAIDDASQFLSPEKRSGHTHYRNADKEPGIVDFKSCCLSTRTRALIGGPFLLSDPWSKADYSLTEKSGTRSCATSHFVQQPAGKGESISPWRAINERSQNIGCVPAYRQTRHETRPRSHGLAERSRQRPSSRRCLPSQIFD